MKTDRVTAYVLLVVVLIGTLLNASTRALSPLTKSLDLSTIQTERLTNNTFDDCRPSLFVDSLGKTHIAWAGGPDFWSDLAIYYACKSATGWEIEQLPKPSEGMVNLNPSLFVDSHGRPHIAWISAPHNDPYGWDVWYAVREEDTWEMDQITNWGSENHQVSLFLDSSDNPHIAWDARYYNGLWGIHYACNIAGTWMIETIHNEDDASPSLFIDSSNTPHILWRYIHYGLFQTGYGVRKGGGWITETLQGLPGRDIGGNRRLYVDQFGFPHVAVTREISIYHEELYYGNKTGGSWSFDRIRDSTASNQNPNIFLDSAGTPYVAWMSNAAGNYDVYVATMGQEDWLVVNVSETPIDEFGSSLFVDSSDGVHLAWYSPNTGSGEAEVYYAKAWSAPIHATIDIDPDTLNLKSNGNWITAYITLPSGYKVEDIVLETVKVNGISAAWSDIQNGVYMAKFDRATIQSHLTNEPDYESAPKFCDIMLTVTGGLTDGTLFEGSDTIRVIRR